MSAPTLRIEIDEMPMRLWGPTTADYIGRQISAALTRPLVTWQRDGSEFGPGLAHHWWQSDDGKCWVFELDPGACWSDGEPVTADNVIDGLLAAHAHPTWARHLRCLHSAQACDSLTLSLTLKWSFHPLLALLSVPDLGPLREGTRASSGPYVLRSSSTTTIELTPNQDAPFRCYPSLSFFCNRDTTKSTGGFLDGRYDITSSTGFPLGELPRWRRDRHYRTRPTGILMQLEFAPQGQAWLADPRVRRSMSTALDRDGVANSLNCGIAPAQGFAPSCVPGLKAAHLTQYGRNVNPRTSPTRGKRLRLMLNDYEPNLAVCEALAQQWQEALGIRTELVCVDFEDIAREDFDVLLALRYPSFPHAWATIEHLGQQLASQNPVAFGRYRRLMLEWLHAPPDRALPMDEFAKVLDESLPVIPLFEVLGHWLQRDLPWGFEYPDNGYFHYPEPTLVRRGTK